MRNVEPKVFLIAKSSVTHEIDFWLDSLNVPAEARRAITGGEKTQAEKIIESAGRRCYMSFAVGMNKNVSRIRENIGAYVENILSVAHGSILEHATFSFALENISRVMTAELNRHRAGVAISEGSQRYIRFDDIPYWIPLSIRANNSDSEKLANKKLFTRQTFAKAFNAAEVCYKELLELWKEELSPESKFKAKKEITSMMRRIIPMGVATGGIWTLNLRALRHVCEMRCSVVAEEEICLVASMILDCMMQAEPNFFKDFSKNEQGYWTPKFHKV